MSLELSYNTHDTAGNHYGELQPALISMEEVIMAQQPDVLRDIRTDALAKMSELESLVFKINKTLED